MIATLFNTKLLCSRGARENLGAELKEFNAKRIFLVIGKHSKEHGIYDEIVKQFPEDAEFEVFNDIKPNPTLDNVKEGVELCNNFKPDIVVTCGGGSVIDTAKAIALIYSNPGHENDIIGGFNTTPNNCVPIIAMPTTHGTASEITFFFVITDDVNHKKIVCGDAHAVPKLAIVDSELMESMPKSLAASTGMDAITHALECYICNARNEVTDMVCMESMKLLFDNLEKAVNEKDKDAIEKVALGQYLAGIGFGNAGVGIVHSMAHQLGAVYDTPHGLANAILLPFVMKFNGEVSYERFRNVLIANGCPEAINMNKEELINAMVDKLNDMSRRVGIETRLAECGVKDEDIEMLSKMALADPCTPGNPRDVNENDIATIYREAM